MDICHQILSIMNNALRNILVPVFWGTSAPIFTEYVPSIESIGS